MQHQAILDQLAKERRRAGRQLAVERALRAILPLALAAGVWAVLAIIGLHERLPLGVQSLSAALALALFALLAWRARRAWRAPTEAEARARLAADCRFDAGAFDALLDQPTRYDGRTSALWRIERERALARAEKAKAGPARPRLNDVDPLRLRHAVALALVVALGAGGLDAPDRLARAFLPDPAPLLGDQALAIEAWATPADYTRAPPVSLSDRVGERVATPPAVEVTVRLTGPTGAPRLVFEGAGGRRSARFARTADGAWEARMEIPGAGKLKIVRFHTRAFWSMAPAIDAAPRAAFTAPITQVADERVTIGWRARDDFGIRRLALRVRPVSPPPGLSRADPIDTELEAPSGDPREAEGESEIDLADHPYAGMEVEAQIVAFDATGQAGASSVMRFAMPEKVFLQPLARAAIEIRRHLLAERRAYRPARAARARTLPAGDVLFGDQRIELRDVERRPPLERAPEGVRRAARLIDALTMAPQDGYFTDLAVFLGLRLARSELNVAEEIEDAELAADTLWRTALRAEYGGAGDARRALEEAQRQLAEALAQGAPPERLRQLFDALRRATENYMQSLVQEALRNGGSVNTEDTAEQTELSARDIEEMLEQVQQLAEQGRHNEARELLDMLAGILANLDVQLQQGQGGEGEEQQLQQSMDGLSQTMGEQRALRDETQQNGEGGGGQQQGGQGGDALAERQAELREGLGEAQRMANEAGAAPSQDLEAAGQAMRRAEEALRRGDFDAAEAAQTTALDRLREGAEALAAEMRERGREQGGERGESGAGRDPLGRGLSGGNSGEGGSNIPTRGDPARAREIFDEIRRRAQDPSRPEAERDYLRRLLDRFDAS